MSIFKRKKQPSNSNTKRSESINSTIDPMTPDQSGFYTAQNSDYWLKKHDHVISLINSNCRLSDYHFEMYYIQAIRNFCGLTQAFPASEYHHHSYPGGLIEHTLDVAKSAVIYARKFLYTESDRETEIEETLDVFMYCCFCAALMHDAGKIVTDLDVVYYNKESEICVWLPFGNSILIDGTKYKWRYSPVRNKDAHESAAPSLIQSIVPFEGLYWMRSRTPKLWQLWLHTIAGRSKLGGDIGKVIEYCDSHSVQKSMNPGTSKEGQGTNTRHTLAERFLTAFRQLIESGTLPLNRKGAGGWVLDDYVYLVSQRAVESAIPLVKAAGGTGIPSNDVTIFSMLCDAGVAERHSVTNDVIHSMKITLEDDGWSGDLTFLKISKDIIDPNGRLGLVDGKITLSDLTQDKGYNAKRDKKSAGVSASDDKGNNKPDDFNSVSSDLMNQAFINDKAEEQLNLDPSLGSSLSGSLDSMFNNLNNKSIPPKVPLASDTAAPKTTVATVATVVNDDTAAPSAGGMFDDLDFSDIEEANTELTPTSDSAALDVTKATVVNDDTAAPSTDGMFDDIENAKPIPASNTVAPKTTVATVHDDIATPSTDGMFDDLDAIKPVSIGDTTASIKPATLASISSDINNIANCKTKHSDDLSKSNFDLDLDKILQMAKTDNSQDVNNNNQDLDSMFLAVANQINHKTPERTNFIKQANMFISWLDNGLATGVIRYNKISNTKNYCYNCRAGWFICIWSAINAYNESNPNLTINIQRTEKIITELMNLRLLHLSNMNEPTREAIISIENKPNICLKGIFIKRDSLPKVAENGSFVDVSKFMIMP